MWTVAGSAALLASFARVFPTTKFMVVQVGKKIWPDQLGATKAEGDGEWEFTGPKRFEAELFVAPERFFEVAKAQPPYPTVRTYDAKLWRRFESAVAIRVCSLKHTSRIRLKKRPSKAHDSLAPLKAAGERRERGPDPATGLEKSLHKN